VERKQIVRSLNLSENHLVIVKELKEFTGVQDLNLRDNMIESIREVMYLSNLQYLDLHHNRLAGKLPKMDFPSLKTLDISQNELTDASSLSDSALHLLAVLFISHNKLTELPVLVCPHLEIYFFSHNLIDNLENFVLSRTKQVRKIYGFNNLIWGELPDLSFPSL
jgi:Leucine-rich repeat (LRR) protein